jgi:hypothetical protein
MNSMLISRDYSLDINDQFVMGPVDTFGALEQFERSLEALLSSGCYMLEGQLIHGRQLVDRIGGLKLEIRSREHIPPHFHVISADINASFVIEDGSLLNGHVNSKERDLIQYWYACSKKRLIEVWNDTRAADCPVGKISTS